MEKHIQKHVGKVVPFIQDGSYFFHKGLTFYRRRDLHKAKSYLRRAVQLEPMQSAFACQLAIVLSELGEYNEANELLLRVIERDEELTECYYFLANNYAHLGLFGEATKYAERYIECDPEGEFAEHTLDLLDVLTIEQEDDEQWWEYDEFLIKQEKARSFLEKGDFSAAIHLLQEIVDEHPENWAAYNNLALAYFYKGDVAKAKQLLRYILEKNPGNLHALCNEAVFSYYLQEREELLRIVRTLQRVYPISIEHRYKLGVTFAIIGRYDLAFPWLRQLHKRGFEGDVPFYYWYAHAAYYMGYRTLAESMWKKLTSLHPDKKGSEPWRYHEQTVEHIRSLFRESDRGRSLYALYLMSKVLERNEWPIDEHMLTHALFKQFFSYVDRKQSVSATIADAYHIADLLVQKNGFEHEPLYVAWFSFVAACADDEQPFSNGVAWAAAFEYVFRKRSGEKITQQMIADKYGISLATLRKYGQKIKMIPF